MNNTLVAFAAEGVATSVALARRLGLQTETVIEALAGSPLVSPWQAAKLQRIATGEFSAQFALSLALKDVRLALQATGDDRLAVLACLADEWQQAVEAGARRPGPDRGDPRARAAGRNAMTLIGYTMMGEQAGPKQLVRDVALAEEAGFDFAVISDHYFPWLDVQGHAPYAWSVLGAAAQATDHLPLMTYVTCPIRRYHPAVVAQKAATMQLLSDGRFTLGLGAGENLNEHIVGGRWPLAGVRHQMLDEAVEIIRALWAGGTVTYRGKHFEVESAKLWDLPEVAPPIGIAVSGPGSCRLAGRQADAMIATEPRAELGKMFDDAGGSGKPRIGQIALSYDPDQQTAVQRAMEQFRWFTGGWPVNAELPVPASFEVASRTVREQDVATQMPCGPDVERHVAGIRQFEAAGFTHLALVQVGGDTQEQFIRWAATELLPALRAS